MMKGKKKFIDFEEIKKDDSMKIFDDDQEREPLLKSDNNEESNQDILDLLKW